MLVNILLPRFHSPLYIAEVRTFYTLLSELKLNNTSTPLQQCPSFNAHPIPHHHQRDTIRLRHKCTFVSFKLYKCVLCACDLTDCSMTACKIPQMMKWRVGGVRRAGCLKVGTGRLEVGWWLEGGVVHGELRRERVTSDWGFMGGLDLHIRLPVLLRTWKKQFMPSLPHPLPRSEEASSRVPLHGLSLPRLANYIQRPVVPKQIVFDIFSPGYPRNIGLMRLIS
jgi:hypothetical protein